MKEYCGCGCDGHTSDEHLDEQDPMLTEGQPIPRKPKPMSDEQIRRWKETGEGYHTDEIADELLRLRAEVERLKDKYEMADTSATMWLDSSARIKAKFDAHEAAMREALAQDMGETAAEILRARLEEK